MLGLGNSISSNQYPGGWLPSDEGSLEAWYRFGEGISLNGSDVSRWADSSGNENDMVKIYRGSNNEKMDLFYLNYLINNIIILNTNK